MGTSNTSTFGSGMFAPKRAPAATASSDTYVGDTDNWAGSKSSTEDLLFQKQWQQLAGRAAQIGLSEEDAWKAYNAAGRPRGSANEDWMASVTSPVNTVTPNVAPNADLVKDVKSAQGASYEDPRVTAAIEQVRGSDAESAAAQQAAFADAKNAGQGVAAQQQTLIKQLQEQAAGGGPSAALALFQLALGKNINSQASAAAGVRGGNAAAATRNAGLQGAQMGAEAQQGAAAIRAQEQQAATAQLSGTLQGARAGDEMHAAQVADIAAQIRGQDVGKATTVAGLVTAASTLEEAKRGAATGTALSLLQTDMGAQQTNLQALLAKAGLSIGQQQGTDQLQFEHEQLQFQKQQAATAQLMKLLGIATGVGSVVVGGLAGGGGAGATAAAAPATANSGDYIARARANGWVPTPGYGGY